MANFEDYSIDLVKKHWVCKKFAKYNAETKKWALIEICKGLNANSPDTEKHLKYITKKEAQTLPE